MEKVWIKNYQPGVPVEINPDRYASLNDIFEETCRVYQKRPAFVNMGKVLSFATLEEKTRGFASFLQTELGLRKGDRIAVMLPNILQYPIAMFGAMRAGLIVVNVNPLYTPRELELQLKDSGAVAIVVLANFAHALEKARPKTVIRHVIVTELGDLFFYPKSCIINWVVKNIKKLVPKWSIPGHIKFSHVLKIGRQLTYINPKLTGEDIAFLQYTGGTTGRTKGAILTHRNMLANLEQAGVWIKSVIKPGEEIMITALPLYHIFSLTANCLTYFIVGGLNVLITNPRDISGFIKELRQYKFTAITGVNTLFNALLNHPDFIHLNFNYLKITLGGGMAVQKAVADRWKTVTHVPLLEAYGLTEASPAVCINPLNLKEFNGSVGLPIPSTEISIRDENEQELGVNQAGELWVRGPQVMKGYWQLPEETADALRNNWLRTGDIATIDQEGYIRIVDRKKDTIVISGFNVYPNEVEDVIAMMKGVLEVAVVGVEDTAGERVKAFIVPRDPNITKVAIIAHCREYLTGYKVPKEIEFRTELPKTNVGKILRRALKENVIH